MAFGGVIDAIGELMHFTTIQCPDCSTRHRVHVLEVYCDCQCGRSWKCRSSGAIGTEIQDVIDAVLEWAGVGEELEAVMRRHQEVHNDSD